jgi:hypothetical protein
VWARRGKDDAPAEAPAAPAPAAADPPAEVLQEKTEPGVQAAAVAAAGAIVATKGVAVGLSCRLSAMPVVGAGVLTAGLRALDDRRPAPSG